MMDLSERLVALGLNGYEARAYLALLRREGATPAEVARVAGLPRQRVYDVLRTLAERDLVMVVPGDHLRYAAADPESTVAALVQAKRQAMADLERDADDLVEQLTPVWDDGRDQGAPLQYVEVLRDRASAAARVSALINGAEHEYLAFVRPPFITQPTSDDNHEKAQVIRAIHDRSSLSYPQIAEHVKQAAAAGQAIRIVDRLPLKGVIVDRRVAALHLPDPVAGETQYTTVIIEHPDMAELLACAFEALWKTGVAPNEALGEDG
jgi:sugar-specific transcriptional regulator TrmB